MFRGFPRYGVLLLFLALFSASACDDAKVVATGPSGMPSDTGVQTTFSFQPVTLHPEFLPAVPCGAFGTRIIVVVSGGTTVIVRGIGFRFTDRNGHTTLPLVKPIPGSSPLTTPLTAIPSTFPIPTPGVGPLPEASPIPVPGFPPIKGVSVPAGGSLTLPFFLVFDCGVITDGTVVVAVDHADDRGRMGTSEMRVRLAQ